MLFSAALLPSRPMTTSSSGTTDRQPVPGITGEAVGAETGAPVLMKGEHLRGHRRSKMQLVQRSQMLDELQ